jgi:UPF0755 protein
VKRLRAWLLPLGFVLWFAGTGALVWLLLVMPQLPMNGPDKDYVLEVPAGASYEQLGELLAREQVITHPRAWAVFMRLVSEPAELRTGTWVVNRALSPANLLPRIVRGHGHAYVKVLFPEGFTMFDVATRLERFGIAPRTQTLLAMRNPALLSSLGVPGPSAEGYLFPAIYQLEQDQSPEAIVTRLVGTFKKRTKALFDEYARATPEAERLSAHELLVLASVVEREAHEPDEQAVIAGVFMNRLRDPTFRPHRLQADPTVAYGCLFAPGSAPTCQEFDGRRVTPAMVRDPQNAYNTYRIEGLPPGPISNPGINALQAALHPAQHGFFYFVATGGGRHSFSATLSEHNERIHGSP